MTKFVRTRVPLSQYAVLSGLFDKKEVASMEDIIDKAQRELAVSDASTLRKYLSVLRKIGCIKETIDKKYIKLKDFPTTISGLKLALDGVNGANSKKLDALRNPDKFKSLSVQIGGAHYKKYKCQPVVFSIAAGLSGTQLLVIKYLMRYRDKNGVQDLQKAKHLCDICVELSDTKCVMRLHRYLIDVFIELNQIEEFEADIIRDVCLCYWSEAADKIQKLTEKYAEK